MIVWFLVRGVGSRFCVASTVGFFLTWSDGSLLRWCVRWLNSWWWRWRPCLCFACTRHVEKVVPFLELLYFAYLLLKIVYDCLQVWRGLRAERADPKNEFETWLTVSNLCWDDLPQAPLGKSLCFICYLDSRWKGKDGRWLGEH